jgi:transcriptional regulator with XRE-family HTH domain
VRTYGKLRELIRIKFKTIDAFADAMGMSRSALSRKLNGISAWSQSEIEKACSLLGISISQVGEYFFYEV